MDKETHKKICGAKRKNAEGKVCQNSPAKGRTRCRFHGGASLSGIASPTFKHGRYSKVLPTGLRKKFEEAGKDPLLLSHEPELKLLDVKISDLIGELGQGGGPETSAELQKAWKEFLAANVAGDEARVATCLSTMDGIFQRGNSVAGIWRQIFDCIEARRKILESESKRLKDQGQTMGVEQILALIEYLVDVIHQSVTRYADRDTAKKILSKVTTDIGAVVSGSVPRSAATMRLLA
jgi:hypothetical protein